MKLSVVIPARNERESLRTTVPLLTRTLINEKIDYEIVIVDDHSTDRLAEEPGLLADNRVRLLSNHTPPGFGHAVRVGLAAAKGDAVAIFMADASDSPADLVRFFRLLEGKNLDCVFGSRFMKGAELNGYPLHKLILNRTINWFIQILFGLRYNDVTNAFKLYRRSTLDGLNPFLSAHFNLTVELPLKAIVRGHSYAVLPNSWHNRKNGVSKLKLREMGSRYLFIIIYCFIEKWLSRGDYHKRQTAQRNSSRSTHPQTGISPSRRAPQLLERETYSPQ